MNNGAISGGAGFDSRWQKIIFLKLNNALFSLDGIDTCLCYKLVKQSFVFSNVHTFIALMDI